MKVVHISETPLASAPYQIVRCLKNYSDIDVELVNAKVKYNDGRSFPYYRLVDEESKQIISQADVVHIHNQLPSWVSPLLNKSKQKVVATLHSYPKMYNWYSLIEFSNKSYVIRQPYQIKEYKNELPSLATPIDIYSDELKANTDRPVKRDLVSIKINYAPSNRKTSTSVDSKGYQEILPELQRLQPSRFLVDHYYNVIQSEDLKRKSTSHILIDDLTNASTYHLTGLFGLSFGCAVLSGMSDEDFISFYNTNFKKHTNNSPFVHCKLGQVYDTITKMSPEQLIEKQFYSRMWMEEFYNPKDIAKEYLEEYEKLF